MKFVTDARQGLVLLGMLGYRVLVGSSVIIASLNILEGADVACPSSRKPSGLRHNLRARETGGVSLWHHSVRQSICTTGQTSSAVSDEQSINQTLSSPNRSAAAELW